jgi:hypothetical protein
MSKKTNELMRTAIVTSFKTVWDASQLGPAGDDLAIEWPNQKFEQPASGPWFRFEMIMGTTEPIAIGQRQERTPFVLMLQCFLPDGTGSTLAFQAADVLGELDYQVSVFTDVPTGSKVHLKYRTAGSASRISKMNSMVQYNVSTRGQADAEPGTSVLP